MVILLTFLGVIPFGFFALLPFARPDLADQSLRGLLIYTAVITAFISGSHWGIVLRQARQWPWLILANVIALMSCLALWLNNLQGIVLGGICLCVLLIAEYPFYQQGRISPDYWRVRVVVTLLVMVFLSIHGVYQ